MIKDLSKDTLLEYHSKYVGKEDYDNLYHGYRVQFDAVRKKISNWSNISAEDFRTVALKFANAWRSRTKSSPSVAEKVVNNLKKVEQEFVYFEKKDIRTIDLDVDKLKITAIFESLEDVNPTARAKILYMMNERVFPIWDDAIRDMYGVCGNAQGYHTFMILIQRQISQLGVNNIAEIEKITKVPILKVIDEYNWYLNNRD